MGLDNQSPGPSMLVMTVFEQSYRMVFECISISIYLESELTLIDTKVLSAGCPLAVVPDSACEMSPPRRHLTTTCDPEDSIIATTTTFLRT
jgi:hypothetical protein